MNATDIDLTGCYDICYSPNDEEATGKGYYVDLLWVRKDSPLFRNSLLAEAWARKNGGSRRLRG